MLRIITGTAKNVELKVPNSGTRPMTDRAKTSLFDMIQNKIPGSTILDLFAGSGALGLESLSRGARYAIFVDIAGEAIDCITENIANCKFEKNQYALVHEDAMDYLLKQVKKVYKNKKGDLGYTKYPLTYFDIIFITPPYKDISIESIRLSARLLKEDGILITDCPIQDSIAPEIADLVLVEKRQYGKFDLYFYLHKAFSESL
jgi:16S rRNA (guanine(966)-N(2))-methyltransferase RsmD